MIAGGPSLVESLPTLIHDALTASLEPGEQLYVAARAQGQDCLAVTASRVFRMSVDGAGKLRSQCVPLTQVRDIEVEAGPLGGRLSWLERDRTDRVILGFAGYDGGKFHRVAATMRQLASAAVGAETSRARVEGDPRPAVGDTASCGRCGHPTRAGSAYCGGCGARVSDACSECGSGLDPADRFCSQCGATQEPAPTGCSECGAPGVARQCFCTVCGFQMAAACGCCGRVVRAGWTYCPSCGETLVDDATDGLEEIDSEEDADEASLELPRPDPERLNRLGVSAFERDDFHEACRYFSEAVRVDPQNAGYQTNLGVAFGELGDDLQAFAAYRRAIELDPDQLPAYLHMGSLFLERERHTDAREIWERLIRQSPKSEEAAEAREYLRQLDDV